MKAFAVTSSIEIGMQKGEVSLTLLSGSVSGAQLGIFDRVQHNISVHLRRPGKIFTNRPVGRQSILELMVFYHG